VTCLDIAACLKNLKIIEKKNDDSCHGPGSVHDKSVALDACLR